MKITIILLLLISFSSGQAMSGEKVSRFIPGAEPDRVVLTIAGDPATSMAVTWRTDTTINESVAQISRNLPTIHLADSCVTVTGMYEEVAGDGVVARYHSVTFTGLSPETSYAYRVGSGTAASEWLTFTTASASPKPFSFLYFGDSQIGKNTLYSRVVRQAYRSTPDATLMIFTGDLVDGGSGLTLHDDEWGEWHEAAAFITAEIPVIATPGNHEYYNPTDRTKRELNKYWRAGFTLPLNGPEGLEETAYSIDYQGVRFISVNSDEMLRNEAYAKKQAVWVEGLLKDNPCKWTIIAFHHPLYSTSARRDNKVVRELLKPLFDRYNVDMVLNGHDHTYARGMVMPDVEEKSNRGAGTVYIVSVSGAKQYQQDATRWWDIGLTYTQVWQAITVDRKELTFKAFDASGSIVDHFVLKKGNNGRKRLEDHVKSGR